MNTAEKATQIATFLVEEKIGYDNLWVEDPVLGEIFNEEAQNLFDHYYDVVLNILS